MTIILKPVKLFTIFYIIIVGGHICTIIWNNRIYFRSISPNDCIEHD